MRPTALWIALAAATLGASALARDTIPEATPVGAPQSCITRHRIDQTLVHGDSVIDFKMIDRKVYRNTLPNPCPDLGYQERFSFSVSIDQLCSQDIITVLFRNPIGTGAGCRLGQFQQVMLTPDRAKRP